MPAATPRLHGLSATPKQGAAKTEPELPSGPSAQGLVPARRVALVIANGKYAHVEPLKNPANDANRVDAALRRMGFASVVKLIDLDLAGMNSALKTFAREAAQADLAMLYYAGHGIEVDGQNYLIPIDARLERVGDVELEALSLRLAMSQLEGTRILSLIVLDACRNNPFRARMVQRAGKRSIGRGLASVEPDQNTLVAFAAREGTTADDGEGNSSPFTLALARHIETTNLDVRILFGRVRDEVMRTTNRQQQPHVYGSLGGTSIFLAGNRR